VARRKLAEMIQSAWQISASDFSGGQGDESFLSFCQNLFRTQLIQGEQAPSFISRHRKDHGIGCFQSVDNGWHQSDSMVKYQPFHRLHPKSHFPDQYRTGYPLRKRRTSQRSNLGRVQQAKARLSFTIPMTHKKLIRFSTPGIFLHACVHRQRAGLEQ